MRRLVRFLAPILLAAQLLAVLPAAAAQTAAVQASHAHCNGTPPDHCPCCPDDSDSMSGCFVMCALSAAVTPSIFVIAIAPAHTAPMIDSSTYQSSLADPPLKPPPIA